MRVYFKLILVIGFCLSSNSICLAQEDTKKKKLSGENAPQSRYDKIVLLSPYEAITYINNYRDKFTKRNNPRHTKSVYLEKKYFSIIHDFFKDSSHYDGIRIFFASYNKFYDSAHTHQKHPKQITIILAPTKNKVAQLGAFEKYAKDKKLDMALNHGELCPNACDITTGGTETSQKLNIDGNIRDSYIFLPEEEAQIYIHNYRKRYTKLGNKKHSKSLWMPKANFEFIDEFLKNNSKDFSGVTAYFASYNKLIEETKNVRKKQITLLFTATDKTKEPDFYAFIKYYCSKYGCGKSVEREMNENHGELCPNACAADDY